MATLTFSPTAWAKLLYLKKISDMEVGGFGISKEDDPLYVTDFVVVEQECTSTSTDPTEEGLEKFFIEMEENGLKYSQFFRIWIHTHPGMAPTPSGTDEKTFDEMFPDCKWAIMVIVGKEDKATARLQLNKLEIVNSVEMSMDIAIDWNSNFPASCHEEWKKEYEEKVSKKSYVKTATTKNVPRYGETWYGRSAFPGWAGWEEGYGVLEDKDDDKPPSEQEMAQAANEASLEECYKDIEDDDGYFQDCQVLRGKLKELIDDLPDIDKMWLIDEMDDYYDLKYMGPSYSEKEEDNG